MVDVRQVLVFAGCLLQDWCCGVLILCGPLLMLLGVDVSIFFGAHTTDFGVGFSEFSTNNYVPVILFLS